MLKQDERAQRLAEALRENLRKRKAQARGVEDAAGVAPAAPPPPAPPLTD